MNWRDFYTVYINLDHRTDRREEIERELKKVGIVAERISGIYPKEYTGEINKIKAMLDRTKGAVGCHFSHVKALNNALSLGKSAFILEDDVIFSSDIVKRLDYIQNFIDHNEWDLFWLSATVHINPPYWHKKGHNIDMPDCACNLCRDAELTKDPRILKTYGCFCTCGYLINYKSIPKIIELLDKHVDKSLGLDWLYVFLEPQLKTYCFVPGMVTQRASHSDISSHHSIGWDGFHSSLGPYFFKDKMEDFDPLTFNWGEAQL